MDFDELDDKRKEHLLGGGKDKQKEQRKKGKMTAFERINTLFDVGSFEETDPFVTHDCHDFGMETKKTLGDGMLHIQTAFRFLKINNRLSFSPMGTSSLLKGQRSTERAELNIALKAFFPCVKKKYELKHIPNCLNPL
jgi:hypothetical protein